MGQGVRARGHHLCLTDTIFFFGFVFFSSPEAKASYEPLLSATVRRLFCVAWSMCRKQFAVNAFCGTTRPRAFIFGMKHCVVNLFKVGSIGDARVQNGHAAGGLGFENELCLKIFSRTARVRCLKFGR